MKQINNVLPQLNQEAMEELYHMAFSVYNQGRYEQASGLFHILTIQDPRQRRHWMGLGASLQMSKHYSDALAAYEMAAMMQPADPHVHIHASDCYFAENNVKEGLFALDCAERALSLEPNSNPGILEHINLMRQAWRK